MNRNRVFAIAVLAVLLSASSLLTDNSNYYPYQATNDNYEEWLAVGERQREQWYPVSYYEELVAQDLTIDEYYYATETHTMVIDFFVRLTGSERIALPIIYHAELNNIPLALIFSVSWVESRFKPYAYNNNPTTVDRGLFQLNSASFAHLSLEEFFNVEINSLHAARYLRYCLDKGAGDSATALAIYNAGLGRVRRNNIPATTRRYMSLVLDYREQLTRRFNSYMAQQLQIARDTQQS